MPANFQSLTPLRFLERSAAVFPEKLAIVYGDRRLTYREFARKRPGSLERCRPRGSSRATASPTYARTSPSCWSRISRCRSPARVLVAINTRLSPDEIAYICDHSGAQLLIVAERAAAHAGSRHLGDVAEVVVIAGPVRRRHVQRRRAPRCGPTEIPAAVATTSRCPGRCRRAGDDLDQLHLGHHRPAPRA